MVCLFLLLDLFQGNAGNRMEIPIMKNHCIDIFGREVVTRETCFPVVIIFS